MTQPGNFQVPAYLLERAQNAVIDTSKFTAGIGTTRGPHLTVKNGRFSWVGQDGESKVPVDNNGNALFHQQRGAMFVDVLVIDASDTVSKVFYENGFVDGESTPPDCWSNDGFYPDPSVGEPVSDMCSGCPMNRFGTARGERTEGKACADRKKLAIMNLWDLKGPIYEYSVSPKNLKPWQGYAYDVAGRVPGGVTSVITRIFAGTGVGELNYEVAPKPAEGQPYPNGAGWFFVPQQVFPILDAARESVECKRAIGADAAPMRQLAAPQQQQQLGYQAQPDQQQQPSGAATPQAPRRPRRTRAEIEAEKQMLADARSGAQTLQPQSPPPPPPPPPLVAPVAGDPFATNVAGTAQQGSIVGQPIHHPASEALPPELQRPPAGPQQNFGVTTGAPAVSADVDSMLAGLT